MGLKKIQTYGVVSTPLSNTQRWLCFLSIFFIGVMAALNLFKAAPVIQYIAADLNMPQTMVSQIMGSYSLPAVILAFPAMWLCQKMGFKFATVLSTSVMLLGTLVCSFVDDAQMFLLGRVLEGSGYGLIAIIGPNMVPRLFSEKKMGLTMGIWSQWLTIGPVLSFFITPVIFGIGGGAAVPFSWRGVWLFSLALEAICIIFALLCFKMPAIGENELAAKKVKATETKKSGRSFMGAAMVVSAFFMVYVFIYVCNIGTFYPTFLQNNKGMTVMESSMLTNVISILGIIIGIASGILADKLKARKWFVVIGYLFAAVACFFFLYTNGPDLVGPWVGAICMAFVVGMVPTCTRALIPAIVVDPKKTDTALTTMGFFLSLAKVIGGYTVSPILVAIGYYANAMWVMAPLALLAAVVVAIFVKSERAAKALREQDEQSQ